MEGGLQVGFGNMLGGIAGHTKQEVGRNLEGSDHRRRVGGSVHCYGGSGGAAAHSL